MVGRAVGGLAGGFAACRSRRRPPPPAAPPARPPGGCGSASAAASASRPVRRRLGRSAELRRRRLLRHVHARPRTSAARLAYSSGCTTGRGTYSGWYRSWMKLIGRPLTRRELHVVPVVVGLVLDDRPALELPPVPALGAAPPPAWRPPGVRRRRPACRPVRLRRRRPARRRASAGSSSSTPASRRRTRAAPAARPRPRKLIVTGFLSWSRAWPGPPAPAPARPAAAGLPAARRARRPAAPGGCRRADQQVQHRRLDRPAPCPCRRPARCFFSTPRTVPLHLLVAGRCTVTFAPRSWLSRSASDGLAVMSTWKLRERLGDRVLADG